MYLNFLRYEMYEPLSNLLPIFHMWDHSVNGKMSGISIIFSFFLMARLCSMQDLSYLTRYQICVPWIGKTQFSNHWTTKEVRYLLLLIKLIMYACMLSCFHRVQLFATLWTVVHQAPLSMGILQARVLESLSSRGSSGLRDQICISYISYIGRWVLYH